MNKSFILVLAAMAMVACNTTKSNENNTEASAVVKEKVAVKSVKAEPSVVNLTETYTSEILPFKENDITPAAQGLHIERISVDVGDHVYAGQVIVTLDQTTLKQQELNLATTQDNYDRMVPVHAAGGISDQQLTQMKNTLDLQKEVVENLRKNSTIKSPITGVVTARNFENGDLFASMPILHIMQINKLKVKANVSEQYFTSVKVGQKVDIEVDIFPGEKFEGSVSRISPALDPATRTFGVEITIPNSNERLRPGMYARATFNMGQREGLLIDDVAVQKQTGSSERFVYVIKDGVAEYRFVKDGRRVGDKVEILSGLQAGEEVATTSFVRLSDGAEVEIVNE
ncbi:MAG: efflux RND transporter periplasmic adaptor subunit [Alistipes sp.]|mgnify:FL=1|nr:efflux RND transporter periplasmic adaptor subunit [Alistipes sp.]MBR3892767.1 efflux RND transporter periplasmic adaptor subunit [Alistipes sp.]